MTGLEEAAGGGTSGEGNAACDTSALRLLNGRADPKTVLIRTNSGGHYYSLLKGVCAGFFLPFLPLFFFRTQIFSKRCLFFLLDVGQGKRNGTDSVADRAVFEQDADRDRPRNRHQPCKVPCSPILFGSGGVGTREADAVNWSRRHSDSCACSGDQGPSYRTAPRSFYTPHLCSPSRSTICCRHYPEAS